MFKIFYIFLLSFPIFSHVLWFMLAFLNILLRCSVNTSIHLGETNPHWSLSKVSHELFQKVDLDIFFPLLNNALH